MSSAWSSGVGNLGAIVGAFTATSLGRRFGVGHVIVGAAALGGPAALLVPLASLGWAIPLLIIAQALIGFSALVYNINQVSLRQSITPERMQGRMNATMRFIVWGTIPIGATLGGIIATAIGVTQALWIGSILGCVAFLPVLLGPVRGLRELPSAAPDELPTGAELAPASTPDPATEAALSGYEPMGISQPGSLEALSERSGQERRDTGGERGEREGTGHGQDGGRE